MTPRRARRSRQTSSDLQCSNASNCVDTNARKPILLPTELVYEITTLVLSNFFAELFLGPSDDEKSNELSWDAVTALLHSTCKFRACTTQLLRDLDEETFFHGSTRKIINFYQVLAPLRRLSQLVYSAPNTIFSIPQPSILKHRTIRQPRTRLARIAHYILMNAARTNAFIIYGVRRQKMRNETYSEKDLQGFQRDFMAIPAHVRYAILGRVIGRVVERLVVWERLLEFEDVVVPFFNLSMFFNPFHTAVANLPHGMLPGPTPVQPVPPEFYFLHFDLCAKFNIQFNDVPRITKEELTRVLFYHTVRELGHRGLGELGVVSTAQFKAQIGLLAEDEEAVVFDREFDPGPLSENFVCDIQVDPALDTFWGFAI